MLRDILFSNHDDVQTNYDAIRYSYITVAIAVIHAIFSIVFFLMNVYVMGIYNFFIVIMYYTISQKYLTDTSLYTKLFFIYMTEIVIHSSLATIFVGWNYDFMYYLLALIPVSFYISFSLKAFKRKLFYPLFATSIVAVLFISLRVVSYLVAPIYPVRMPFKIFFSVANDVIAFACTFLFSALFAIEVHSMQLRMETKQEILADQASVDPLTNFLNRRSMEERLTIAHRNAIINNINYSLIMGDIDKFKSFNDTYGHDCGDYVLQTISKIIMTQTRVDDSVCRWGGEEFLILVQGDLTTSVDVAERIRSAIENYEFYYEGKALHVTITFGVSTYYINSKQKTLIDIADKRLYKGKENGRNQVVYR